MKTYEIDGFIMGVVEDGEDPAKVEEPQPQAKPEVTINECSGENLELFELWGVPGVSTYDLWRMAINLAQDREAYITSAHCYVEEDGQERIELILSYY